MNVVARQLDEAFPGWHTAVDVNVLQLNDASSCVLGQMQRRGMGDGWIVETMRFGSGVLEPAFVFSSFTPHWVDAVQERRGVLVDSQAL